MRVYKRRSRLAGDETAPESTYTHRTVGHPTETVRQHRGRRAASQRMESWCPNCRTADPWVCRCYDAPLTEKMITGYREAALHLAAYGLLAAPRVPEMRVMWRRGGDDQRLVRGIAEQWEMAA
jgi:hypothetical protein